MSATAATADDGGSQVFVAVRIRPRILRATNAAQTAERHLPTAASRVGDDTIRMTELRTQASILSSSSNPSQSPVVSSQSGVFASSNPSMAVSERDVKSQTFTFDAVFDEDSTQEDLYNDTTLNAVDAALEGGNSTIMTYGQTGSGKTFTVLGVVSQNPLDGDDVVVKETGLFLRVLRDILAYKKHRANAMHVVVCISVIEIYLDNVRDLLGKDSSANLKVAIHTDTVEMPDLTVTEIADLRDAVGCYKQATARRISRATDANDQSSRSHAVFAIEIFQQERTDANPTPLTLSELTAARDKGKAKAAAGQPFSCGKAGLPPVRHSRIVLTDLAGSEKMKTANAKGEALEEMKKINGSLTSLGNVVHALHENAKHIPYRDSKLTIILRSSFASARSHVVLIANVAPTSLTYDETLSTLFFANKVKAIKPSSGTAQDATTSVLESEMLTKAKIAEDICADLAIASEQFLADGFVPPVSRRVGIRVGRLGVTTVTPAKAALQQAIEAHRKASEAAKIAAAKAQEAELLEIRGRMQEERMRGTIHRRRTMEGRVDEAREDLAKAKQIRENWIKAQETEAAAASGGASDFTQACADLEARRKAVEAATKALEGEHDKIRAAMEKIEADFKAAHADEARVWDEEDRKYAVLDSLHDKQQHVVGLRCEVQRLRGAAAEATEHANLAAVESRQAERQYVRELAEEWLRPVVFAMADQAVEDSKQQRTGRIVPPGVRPPVGPGAMAPRVPKLPPSGARGDGVTPPVTRPTRHEDPNSATGSNAASPRGVAAPLPPKLPPRNTPAPAAPGLPSPPPPPPPPPPPGPEPKGTVFDNPKLIRDVLGYVATGAPLLKHGRSGKPHTKWFYLTSSNPATPDVATADPSTIRINWCDSRELQGVQGMSSMVQLSTVSDITLGQCTAVFERTKRRDDYYNSFSLHYMEKQQPRTLDMVASTTAELEAWVLAIATVTAKNPTFPRPLETVERLPPGQEVPQRVADCCREWHIRAATAYAVWTKLVDAKIRRDGAPVPITPGGLRHLVGTIDIFRADALWYALAAEGVILNSLRVQHYLDFDLCRVDESRSFAPATPPPAAGSPRATR